MTTFCAVRDYFKAQFFINICRKDSTFQGTSCNGRRQEKSLIEGTHNIQACTYFLTQTRSSQTISAAVDTCFFTANISANGSQTAAGIFDQRTNDHICAYIGRFSCFNEFAVAVVYHTNYIRFYTFYKSDQFADSFHRKCGTHFIAFGTLDSYQFCFFVDGFADIFVVKRAIFQQIYFSIGNAKFCQRTRGFPQTNDFFQCVIRSSYRRKQFISGQQVCRKGNCQRMGTACDLRTNQCCFCMECGSIHFFQHFTALIVIAITSGTSKAFCTNTMFLHSCQYLCLIIFCYYINGFKAFFQIFQNLFTKGFYFWGNPQHTINLFHFYLLLYTSRYIHQFHPSAMVGR